ncbi:MIP/aquaporin family protein [Arsenicicoccus dermatophilus]|uniref:MIP/aquaporin family protein n=1 Tax=Arsenicicoccus dermatophilus TaxID=1076331 RepID=UPI00391707AA
MSHLATVAAAAERVPLGTACLHEFLGTAILILLGCGVVANALLPHSKGKGGGNLMINVGWGIGVMAGVYVAFSSGAHLNPAVTLGLWANGAAFAPGVPASAAAAVGYVLAQLAGAVVGAVLCWLAYRDHFDAEGPAGDKLAVFATGPAIRSHANNVLTEIIATFVLVFVIVCFGTNPAQLGPLPVTFLVIGIGASLGGPTGYAINPARDLGPRIAHALLPIRGKGASDWAYSWVPVVGPVIGGVLAGLLGKAFVG